MRHALTVPRKATVLLLLGIAALLSGCETDGSTQSPLAALTTANAKKDDPAKPAEPAAAPQEPMTHARAASECWMSVEKGRADANLDKRADFVTKCIDEKMK